MALPEFVPVMYIELIIFFFVALGLQQLAAGTFLTPLIWSLGLAVVLLVVVLMAASFAAEGRGTVLRDPDWEWLTRVAAFLTNFQTPDLSVTEEHVRDVTKAAYDLQLAFTFVYYLHVAVIWAEIDENVEPDSDFWRFLFHYDLTTNRRALHVVKLNVLVSVAMLAVLMVISFVLWVGYLGKQMRSITEYRPSGFWFLAVGVAQIIQYTLYLYSFGSMGTDENDHSYLKNRKWNETAFLFLAFIPWVADLVFNAIIAENVLHGSTVIKVEDRTGGLFRKKEGQKSPSKLTALWIGLLRVMSPVALLVLCTLRLFVYVHEVFWYINIVLLGLLILSRVVETYYECNGSYVQSVPKPEEPRQGLFSRSRSVVGVQQPRYFFKRRAPARSKAE